MTTLSKDFHDAVIAEKVILAKLAAEPDAQGVFQIIIATKRDGVGDLVVDHDGDIYRDGAIGIQRGVPIGCDQHSDCQLPPAGFADTGEDDRVIYADGRLDLTTDHGKQQYAQWKERRETQEFSYRYIINEQTPATVEGRRVNELIRVSLISIDPVGRGAGINTGIRSLKNTDDADCKCGGSTCSCGGHAEDGEDVRALIQAERKRFEEGQARESMAAIRRDFRAAISSASTSSVNNAEPERGRYKYVQVEPTLKARRGAMFGIVKAMANFAPDAAPEKIPYVYYFRTAGEGEDVAFASETEVSGMQRPGDSLANEIWVSANLKDEQAASVAYHEVTHALNPRMAEAQVEVETGYFDASMKIQANRPNFDLMEGRR